MRKIYVSIMATCLLTGVLLPAFAQPKDAAKSWHVLKVHKVRPGVMAWWLDPQDNPEPLEFRLWQRSIETAQGTIPGAFAAPLPKQTTSTLPVGIDSIASADRRSEILAFGTDEAALELEKIVAALDKPLRQVEITAQYIAVEPAAAKSLGLDFVTDALTPYPDDLKQLQTVVSPMPELSPTVLAPRDIQDKLDKLVADGKAKIINALLMSTIDRVPASLGFTTSTPTRVEVLGPGSYKISLSESRQLPQDTQLVYVASSFAFAATSVVNANETITLPLQLSNNESLAPYIPPLAEGEASYNLRRDDQVLLRRHTLAQTVVRARDGQTIAVAASAYLGAHDAKKPKDGWTYFLLVTPRLIRRADKTNIQYPIGNIVQEFAL